MTFYPVLVIAGAIVAIVLAIEFGYRVGLRLWAGVPADARNVYPAMEGAIFGLMGLLIAFIFYGAASRFETRRSLVAQEANTIGTAYLRLDLLPADAQPLLREDFRTYVRGRLTIYKKIPDVKAVNAELDRSADLQRKLWQQAVEASRNSGPATQSLVLAAMNEMIDITTVRTVAMTAHPPNPVFIMLGLTVLLSSVLAGYSIAAAGNRDWISEITFAVLLSVALYVIIDYEFPRVGLIRLDPVDQVLIDTLDKMK